MLDLEAIVSSSKLYYKSIRVTIRERRTESLIRNSLTIKERGGEKVIIITS